MTDFRQEELKELQTLRVLAYSMLKDKRIEHVRGCEQEAVKLAERWGCSVFDAARAGILHDITKKMTHSEQLILCGYYGIICDSVQMENPKLMHAVTGAVLAKELFGMPEHICTAVRYHTTGRPGMSQLEKVIYLADYIEPGRDFPGVEKLRTAAYKDIDAAMIKGLSMSLEEVRACGSVPHPDTENALLWFQSREVD